MVKDEIVVGLDDSLSATAALGWAAQYARDAGTVLRAVHVLEWPTGTGPYGAPLVDDLVSPEDPQLDQAKSVRVTHVFQQASPEPEWSMELARGHVGRILVHTAREARLLVVGTRENVGPGRILLGSTSHYCFNHAMCPVVAVPVSPVTIPQQGRANVAAPAVSGASS